jgi:hypothetical protein
MRTEQLCEHGDDSTRHTLAGEPLCPLCRLTYRRTTTTLANLRPPALDYAALAAHDLPERDP